MYMNQKGHLKKVQLISHTHKKKPHTAVSTAGPRGQKLAWSPFRTLTKHITWELYRKLFPSPGHL